MKRSKLVSMIALAVFMLVTFISNGQISAPIPSIAVQRIPSGPTNAPGYTNVAATLILHTGSALHQTISNVYPQNSDYTSKTFTALGVLSSTFAASIEGMTSAGTYYLPTTLNQTVIIPATDGLTNYAAQYGYSVSITNLGSNQFSVMFTKVICYSCVPGGVPN